MGTYQKTHFTESIVFDAGSPISFDNVAAAAASVANTVVLARYPVPQRLKIYKVAVNYSAIGATTGTHKFNIVVGNGAEGSVGTGQAVAAAGTTVFAADVPLTSAADSPQVADSTVYDAIYDTGQLLTLRAVTPAGGSITNLKVTMFVKCIDPSPDYTGMSNSTGLTF